MVSFRQESGQWWGGSEFVDRNGAGAFNSSQLPLKIGSYDVFMSKYVSIGRASEMLGVSHSTLRRWDESGKLVAERTPAGRRRYLVSDVATFNPLGLGGSTQTQPDVEPHVRVLEMYCAAQGWVFERRDVADRIELRVTIGGDDAQDA